MPCNPGKTSKKELFNPKHREECTEGSCPLCKGTYHGIFQRRSELWQDARFPEGRWGEGSEPACRTPPCLPVARSLRTSSSPITEAPASGAGPDPPLSPAEALPASGPMRATGFCPGPAAWRATTSPGPDQSTAPGPHSLPGTHPLLTGSADGKK